MVGDAVGVGLSAGDDGTRLGTEAAGVAVGLMVGAGLGLGLAPATHPERSTTVTDARTPRDARVGRRFMTR
jgi:hypothetical protein